MSTYLKYKMHQKANLIKRGQVLAYFGDDLRDVKGSLVDNGFYQASDVSIKRSYNKADRNSPHLYTIGLQHLTWDNDWKATPIRHSVEMRREGLLEHFCIRYPGAAEAAKTYIKELIKDQFQKADRLEDFDEGLDYDKLFGQMAGKLIRKNPFDINQDDQIDMIHDALLEVINAKTIKNYDAKRDIVKFFGGMFQKRMIDQLRAYTTRKVKEKEQRDNPDFTQEEQLDYQRNQNEPVQESPESEVEFRELQTDLLKFLMKQHDGDWQRKIWTGLMSGMSNKDIADKLDVSPAFISKKLKLLQKYIMEYAKKTDNSLLADLMSQMGGRRTSSPHSLPDDYSSDRPVTRHARPDEAETLKKIFDKYKKVVGEARLPAGQVSKILKKNFSDHESYDVIVSKILDDSITTQDFQAELDNFLDELTGMDDIIEDGDKLVGLKVMTTDVRNVEDVKRTMGEGDPYEDEHAPDVQQMNPDGRDLTDDTFYDLVQDETRVTPQNVDQNKELRKAGKKWAIEVSVRDAKKALAILKDSGIPYEPNGSNYYVFNEENFFSAEELFQKARIEILDAGPEE